MATIKGGDRLEAAVRELAKKLGSGRAVQVGFFEDATYPDGTSVAMVAAINEFGAPSRGQPPRPFFRNMIAAKSKEWAPAMAVLMVKNNNNAELVLNLAGEAIKGQLQQSIRDLTSPPLAQSTIDRKGFEKPLIDTSVMINSVGYKVNAGGIMGFFRSLFS